MSWPVIFHAKRPAALHYTDGSTGEVVRMIGALWVLDAGDYRPALSAQYKATAEAVRPPLMLCLPSYATPGELRTTVLCIDDSYTGSENGWTVNVPWPLEDGQKVPLDMSPSIVIGKAYHGFVQNGVVGPDVEGRCFA